MLPLSSWAEDLLNTIVGLQGFVGGKASSFRFMSLYLYGFRCKNTPSSSHFPTAAAAAESLQSCLTLWPHRRQPTRLFRPWDCPGKNSGMGCYHCVNAWVCLSPSTLQKNGFRGSVDSGKESSIQKQLAFQFALLKHPLSESSGCLKGLDIMTHLSGCLRIYQKSSTE